MWKWERERERARENSLMREFPLALSRWKFTCENEREREREREPLWKWERSHVKMRERDYVKMREISCENVRDLVWKRACEKKVCLQICQCLWYQERPYHNDSTASRLLSEVKHCRARLVLRWGTTLESLVLFFCSGHVGFPAFVNISSSFD